MSKHPARNVNKATGKSHGIDDRAVEHGESYGRGANFLIRAGPPQMAGCEHTIADLRDVARKLGVCVDTEQRGDFFARLLADIGFLLPSIAEITSLAGCRNDIRHAAVEKNHNEKDR